MQNYSRLYEYIDEYKWLIYEYYSKHVVAYIITYYNLDVKNTVWEDQYAMNGSYERVGDLSGIKWNKILLFPVYFSEEISTILDAEETGYIKENSTTMVFPTAYGITPYENDLIKLEQNPLRPVNDTYPIFSVSGLEKSANTDKFFWKIKIEVEQSKTTDDIDSKVTNTYAFVDYAKEVYEINTALFLTKLMYKNEILKEKFVEKYDENSGLYFV